MRVAAESHEFSCQPLDESLGIGWTVLGNVIANRLELRLLACGES